LDDPGDGILDLVDWSGGDVSRRPFGVARAFSIGLRLGLGGRNSSRSPAVSMGSQIGRPLWAARLSVITTSPGFRVGARTCWTWASRYYTC